MRKCPLPAHDYYDVVVGASNAGLSAALVLGRARRRVLVLDGGPPRNAPSFQVHSFFTRDGTAPQEVLRIGREQLRPYAVEICAVEAQRAHATDDGFGLTLAQGAVRAAALVLATGVADELPTVPGLTERWGRGVYHCPYCHGWENRHHHVAVYGRGEAGYQQAVLLHQWSPQLTLCTDGPAGLAPAQRAHLAQLGVSVEETPVAALDSTPNACTPWCWPMVAGSRWMPCLCAPCSGNAAIWRLSWAAPLPRTGCTRRPAKRA